SRADTLGGVVAVVPRCGFAGTRQIPVFVGVNSRNEASNHAVHYRARGGATSGVGISTLLRLPIAGALAHLKRRFSFVATRLLCRHAMSPHTRLVAAALPAAVAGFNLTAGALHRRRSAR